MGLCFIDGVMYGIGYDEGMKDAWAAYWVGKTG